MQQSFRETLIRRNGPVSVIVIGRRVHSRAQRQKGDCSGKCPTLNAEELSKLK